MVANIAFVVIVMWPQFGGKDEAAAARDASAQMEQVLNRSVAAYNAGDSETFLALFSKAANPPADSAFFAGTIQGIYQRETGVVSSKTVVSSGASGNRNGGTLVCDATCEKRARARLVAAFVREDGSMKLLSWKLEKP